MSASGIEGGRAPGFFRYRGISEEDLERLSKLRNLPVDTLVGAIKELGYRFFDVIEMRAPIPVESWGTLRNGPGWE